MSSNRERVSFSGLPKSAPGRLYKVYGLIVESELECPELLPTRDKVPDMRVSFGKVPADLDDAIVKASWCQASKREFLMDIEGVARYHVADGQRITIEINPAGQAEVSLPDIRLWLLGSAFGALLHQRGLLPLHVSAVKAPSGVWAFTGQSGEGKSTMAGFLHQRFGWKLVSDDVSVIETNYSEAIIYPGPQKLKLWADALEHLNFSDCHKMRDLSNTEKFQLYLSGDGGYEPEALRGLVLLETVPAGEIPSVERLRGSQAFSGCMEAIYRPHMDAWFKLPERQLGELVQLCQQVKVYRFRRPRSLEKIEQNLAPLLQMMASSRP